MSEFRNGMVRGAGQATGKLIATAIITAILSFTGGYVVGELPNNVPTFEQEDDD